MGEEIQVQQSTTTAYYLRSTALGGQVIAELDETGYKRMGYVFAGGMRIANLNILNPGSGFDITWSSTSPATGSEYMTDIFLARKELDPLGNDVTDAPTPGLVSEPVFYNPKFDQMPLMIEGGPSEEYERANQQWASLMASAFQAVQDRDQADRLWQSGKRNEAMAILMKNPNVGVEYRAIYKNEVIRSGSWFGKDAADFLNGINIAVGMGLLSPVTSATPHSSPGSQEKPQEAITNNATPDQADLLTSGAAEASARMQAGQCQKFFGQGGLATFNGIAWTINPNLPAGGHPQAINGPGTIVQVNPNGGLLTPNNSSRTFNLVDPQNSKNVFRLTLAGVVARAFGQTHEGAHQARRFGKTDRDDYPKYLLNNYKNNYKIWKACFSEIAPVPWTGLELPPP